MTIMERLAAEVGDRRGAAAADRLCELCVEWFTVDAAALSLVFDGASTGTLGASGDDARRYDELQFVLGEGPCLSSVETRAPVLVPDLTDGARRRWPLYASALSDCGVGAVFALPVVLAGEYIGALDLFRTAPEPLTAEQVDGALAVAVLAALPLLDLMAVGLRATAADPDGAGWEDLNALTRVEVSQATGMIVSQLDLEPAHALARLRAHAYATGRSVTAVARDVLDRRLRLEP